MSKGSSEEREEAFKPRERATSWKLREGTLASACNTRDATVRPSRWSRSLASASAS
jgi:hypothetical protein